jgi:hypothetical protein
MITIQTFPVGCLPPWMADEMRPLTKVGSLHSQWFASVAESVPSPTLPDDLVLAVATVEDPESYEIHPVGWASIHCWDGIPCLEMFVAPSQRGKKLATALSICAGLAGNVPKTAIGVFGPESVSIAKNLGYEQVSFYKRVEDGWIKHQEQGSQRDTDEQ